VKSIGIKENGVGLFSAHQMGTCKMGVSRDAGAVRPTGETWEIDNLFVCDTSVFPTPSGVNPMVTLAGVSYGISQHIKRATAKMTTSSRIAGRSMKSKL